VDAATPVISVHPQSAPYNQNVTASSLRVIASVVAGTLSYQWFMNGNAISGAIQSTYIPSTATVGTAQYHVVVTNTDTSVNGTQTASAKSNEATITVNAITSAAELASATSFKIYPNPATTFLRIESGHIAEGDVIRIYTVNGSLIGTYIAEGTQTTINVSHLQVGTYILTVVEIVQRFVKE
jgi:hypothetical protein